MCSVSMKRLFYTDEKTDNRVFQWFLGMQPSAGVLVVDESAKQLIVLLDARYIESELEVQRGREIQRVRMKDSLEKHL